jgi:hypothetical protein
MKPPLGGGFRLGIWKMKFVGLVHTCPVRLSEKSVTRQTTTIYAVNKEQYTLYVVYYEVEKHFFDSPVGMFYLLYLIIVLKKIKYSKDVATTICKSFFVQT